MGTGLHGVIEGRQVAAGSRDMIYAGSHPGEWASRAIRRASWRSALIVFVAVEGRPIGALLLADELRSDTPRAIRLLREAGVKRMVMVTGDRAASAHAIGAALDLDAVLAERVPSDKVDAVRSERRLHPTIMVGDGINDAPALASADVGIALGARGASASSEAAEVVIRRPTRSGRRGDHDRATGAADRDRKHRRRDGAFNAGNAGGNLRLADAGAGGYRSGGDRCRRDP
jgi:cation transport ATPase